MISVKQWLLTHPDFHAIQAICTGTGYAYSTVKNECEKLVMGLEAIRDGAPYKRSPKYAGLVDYFGGRRLV
jgi:hypothetical protein